MTPLSDALVAAQSRAVAALGKQYVGGTMDEDTVRMALASVGLVDETDTNRWLAALDILRETGAALPSVNGDTTPQEKPASPAQKSLIDKLCSERGMPTPSGYPRVFTEASAIIDKIKAGNTDPAAYPELYL